MDPMVQGQLKEWFLAGAAQPGRDLVARANSEKICEKKRIERPMAIMRLLAGTVGLVIAAYLVVNYRSQLVGSAGFSGILFPLFLLALGSLVMSLVAGLRESRS